MLLAIMSTKSSRNEASFVLVFEPISAGLRPLCRIAEGGAASAAAEQVKVRAHLRQRIAGRINAVNPWEWVEDDFSLPRRLLIHASG